jgi:hypothetical protein
MASSTLPTFERPGVSVTPSERYSLARSVDVDTDARV